MTSPNCKYYLAGGKCVHPNAPKPNESQCIGANACNDYKYDEEKENEIIRWRNESGEY